MALLPPKLGAFPDSLYAAELQRGVANRCFRAKLEREYVRAHLANNRALICAACVLGALLAAFRTVENFLEGFFTHGQSILVGVVLAASVVLASVACSPLFARFYLPLAHMVVPVRNALAAVPIAKAVAQGQVEMLMVLPLMVLGPFFFLGLGFRVALLTVLVTVVSFIVSATAFGLALPLALHAYAFLLMTAGACAIAARHLDKWSRTSFLESSLIAELAEHDALTGTKNRRFLDEHLARLWQQAADESRSIGVLLIDVDHFKAYNDRYGHQAGDQALRRVAKALEGLITRPLDALARYGGEEFAVLLYDSERRQAANVADRMRLAVSELAIEHNDGISGVVTISIGVAVIEPSVERRPRGALQLADQKLYDAKLRGRNRVEITDEEEYSQLITGVFAKSSFTRRPK